MEDDLKETLKIVRDELYGHIKKNYSTIEAFCWDKNVNKATISNFLSHRKDFQVSTLLKISKALDKKLVISLEHAVEKEESPSQPVF